jgi:hypothetical protein
MESLLRRIDRAMMGAAQPGVETIDAMRAQLARNATEQSRVRRELDAHETSIWRVGRIAQLEQELADLRKAAPKDGGADARARFAELTAERKVLAVKDTELKNAIAEVERIQRESANALKNAEALKRHAKESDASLQRAIDQFEAANYSDAMASQDQRMIPSELPAFHERSDRASDRTRQINELAAVLATRKRIAELDAELKKLNAELTLLYQRGEPTTEKLFTVRQKTTERRILETGR